MNFQTTFMHKNFEYWYSSLQADSFTTKPNKKSIADCHFYRSFATPPEAVQIVCEGVAIIRGVKEISWKSAKGMMSDPNYLRTLQEMDCDQITLKQQQAAKSHLKKSTKLEQMQSISKAGYGLYKFLLAVLDYCTVFREVINNIYPYNSEISFDWLNFGELVVDNW